MSRILGLGFAVMLSVSSTVALAEAKVIYGDDDRRDVFDSKNDTKLVEWARSTAILIKTADLQEDTSAKVFNLPTESFGAAQGLCKEEPFFEQPTPGFCSGFLVGEDLFVTAGHCVRDNNACKGIGIVFGFGYDYQGKDLSKISSDDVYVCKSVVSRMLEGSNGKDYAVIKLDRAVTGRQPLKLRRSGSIALGSSIAVIGHPSGLPTKIAGGANVRKNISSDPYFVANLDTYGGNSGSAVFNTETGEVEGILVRGETDFVSKGACVVSNRCTNANCRGEDVTKAEIFKEFVPE